MNKNRHILIGGIPGVGKTTVAKELSEQLGIPYLSTDQFRTILGIEQLPNEARTIETEVAQSTKVFEGVARFVESPYPWESMIIEGSAVLPQLVCSLEQEVTAVFLLAESKAQIIEVLRERSTLPWINTKTDAQIEAKADHLWEIDMYIQREASQYGYCTVTAERTDDVARHILSLVQ